jgi:hypothetical protein
MSACRARNGGSVRFLQPAVRRSRTMWRPRSALRGSGTLKSRRGQASCRSLRPAAVADQTPVAADPVCKPRQGGSPRPSSLTHRNGPVIHRTVHNRTVLVAWLPGTAPGRPKATGSTMHFRGIASIPKDAPVGPGGRVRRFVSDRSTALRGVVLGADEAESGRRVKRKVFESLSYVSRPPVKASPI